MDHSDAEVAANPDPMFPSGPWTGFFLQCWLPGRNTMEMNLTFDQGRMQATGSDLVGTFIFQGEYDPADGACQWVKKYVGKHSVAYKGKNQGQGIWGVWEIRILGGLYQDQGVFHIWPKGMTPGQEAEATVQAYLAHLRARWPIRLARLALIPALLLAIFFLVNYFLHFWASTSTP